MMNSAWIQRVIKLDMKVYERNVFSVDPGVFKFDASRLCVFISLHHY